jgi:Skp family chaperone for outer membrane proteins
MNRRHTGVSVLLAWLIVLGVAHGADTRIAVIELQVLIQAHPDTKPNEALLEAQKKDMGEEQEQWLDESRGLKEKFNEAQKAANNPALSEDARDEELKVVQGTIEALRDFEKDYRELRVTRQKEFTDRNRRMYLRTVKEIRKIVVKYAEKKGYAIVISADDYPTGEPGAVMYASDAVNITSNIAELVEKELAK